MSCDDVKILIMKIMMFFVFVFVEWFYLKGEGIMINLLVLLCLGKYDSPSSKGGGDYDDDDHEYNDEFKGHDDDDKLMNDELDDDDNADNDYEKAYDDGEDEKAYDDHDDHDDFVVVGCV